MEQQILSFVTRRGYQPVKPKVLAKQLGFSGGRYAEFRTALRELVRQGRLEFGRSHTVRAAPAAGTAVGVYRRLASGRGFVIPHMVDGAPAGFEVSVAETDARDAATGDEVLVRIMRPPAGDNPATGEVLRVLERATRSFVGTYFERDGLGMVRVDGGVFSHSIVVGDPGAKGAKPDDKVVFEMLRFPTVDDRGEGVITEVLGQRGAPGVDTLSIIRAFDLPDQFPPPVLEEARVAAQAFDERDLGGREDLTKDLIVTIDPATARDFDDAISLTQDAKTGHWHLGVHIADVAHFAPAGSELDREARSRATSVYLPQKVIPMFPEIISNGLASLQEGKVRYVKSVFMEFTRDGKRVGAHFANAAIKVARRFTYEQVSALYQAHPPAGGAAVAEPPADRKPQRSRKKAAAEEGPKPARRRKKGDADAAPAVARRTVSISPITPVGRGAEGEGDVHSAVTPPKKGQPAVAPPDVSPDVLALLLRMRELALTLRARRFKRGALELTMPEVELEYDDHGRVVGAHFLEHDVSHQVIEEFMLAANEAVAGQFADLDVPFLRRVHPPPDDAKLKAFAEFARILGYSIRRETDRFTLQRILGESAERPERHAVHYALLRSLKQAVYSPLQEEHYALASNDYCHFTSPIRRYPDLTVHRLLDQWLRTRRAGSDETELAAVGEHCSKMERRAEAAERELVKLRLLNYMAERLGTELGAIITGVADYGFWAQAEDLPVEGRVHISTLSDDYYYFDESSHTLEGRRTKRRFRLGDKVRVAVVRVDVNRRQLDFRVVGLEPPADAPPRRFVRRQPRGRRRRRDDEDV
jgi:ribonuclease R